MTSEEVKKIADKTLEANCTIDSSLSEWVIYTNSHFIEWHKLEALNNRLPILQITYGSGVEVRCKK